MPSRRLVGSALALALCAALPSHAQQQQAPAQPAPVSDPKVNQAPHDKWARGKVTKIDKGSLAIQDDLGVTTVLKTDDRTKVYTERGEAQEGLSLVQEGSRVMAAFEDSGGEHKAVRVDVWPQDPQQGALKQGVEQKGPVQPDGAKPGAGQQK